MLAVVFRFAVFALISFYLLSVAVSEMEYMLYTGWVDRSFVETTCTLDKYQNVSDINTESAGTGACIHLFWVS